MEEERVKSRKNPRIKDKRKELWQRPCKTLEWDKGE